MLFVTEPLQSLGNGHANQRALRPKRTQQRKIGNRLAFICQSRRERVAALEYYLMRPSSQIFREIYQQTRLVAVEPPGNWRAALERRTNFGPRPGAPNRYSKPRQNLDSKILRRKHFV